MASVLSSSICKNWPKGTYGPRSKTLQRRFGFSFLSKIKKRFEVNVRVFRKIKIGSGSGYFAKKDKHCKNFTNPGELEENKTQNLRPDANRKTHTNLKNMWVLLSLMKMIQVDLEIISLLSNK